MSPSLFDDDIFEDCCESPTCHRDYDDICIEDKKEVLSKDVSDNTDQNSTNPILEHGNYTASEYENICLHVNDFKSNKKQIIIVNTQLI